MKKPTHVLREELIAQLREEKAALRTENERLTTELALSHPLYSRRQLEERLATAEAQIAEADHIHDRLVVERDTANRCLFQAQEAAKDLAARLAKRDAEPTIEAFHALLDHLRISRDRNGSPMADARDIMASIDDTRSKLSTANQTISVLRGEGCAVAHHVDGRNGCGICPACAREQTMLRETAELRFAAAQREIAKLKSGEMR